MMMIMVMPTTMMMTMMQLQLLLLLSIPASLVAQDGNPAQFGQFQDGGYDRHPMLFFSARDVAGLRASAAASSHAHIVSRLHEAALTMMEQSGDHLPPWDPLEFGAVWNEIYGNNLGAMAFYSFLYPNDTGARDFTIEYMDRMAAQSWTAIALPNNNVLIAYSLAGFATAYDLAYEKLDSGRRCKYASVIAAGARNLSSAVSADACCLGHSDSSTKAVAMMIAGLVLLHDGVDGQDAPQWIKTAVKILEKSMIILDEVADGSMSDGVAPGTAEGRALLQYVFLAKRHFNVSHGDNAWLRGHFDFFYRSLQPGFQRTIGLGDSDLNWNYGPEAHLAFLDTYILRNGSGNWLASQINTYRPKNGTGAPTPTKRWSTLHLEYIWYDANLTPTPPPDYGTPALHRFDNWGVVTYGSPQPAGSNATFVGFKSGKRGGAAVSDIIRRERYREWTNGDWNKFNNGHEHPDQNTFVFTPNGVPFIVEGCGNGKFTWHSNVPMFSTDPSTPALQLCKPPWVGQKLESCETLYNSLYNVSDPYSDGRVLAAAEQSGTVFIRGDSADAYEALLGLSSLVRDVVLLYPQLALVVDHVHLNESSTVNGIASFFHNLDWSFEQDKKGILHGAKIPRPDGDYALYWTDDQNLSPRALLVDEPYQPGPQVRATHYAQIEFDVRKPLTRLAYVFLGPAMTLDSLVMVAREESVDVVVQVNGQTYSVLLNSQRLVESANASYCEVTHGLGDVKKTFRATGSGTVGNASSPDYKGDHVQRLAESLKLLEVVFDKVANASVVGDPLWCENATPGGGGGGGFSCTCQFKGLCLSTDHQECAVRAVVFVPLYATAASPANSTTVAPPHPPASGGVEARGFPAASLRLLLVVVVVLLLPALLFSSPTPP
ncbi:LOW QUALITY PROTEIN: dermatan-sulfate epimerase-like [Lethenteron reissneri]|uniref:LOW QUALITY PROTEIN: dermatan-sulfate epimerase-like n=1 Tax=Lethenteron reissneri TaxID=7753 RepID=UPI002AB7BA6B|nr:LOW QUALITY PROTEIN: dermatan-sulfate epimerase-like [Lethenteron reissneri]